MKKPRKSRPKAKPPRARSQPVASRRAIARTGRTPSFEALLHTVERQVTSGLIASARLAERGRATFDQLAFAFPHRRSSSSRATAVPYSRDEREALALLFLPFLLVASAIVVHQSVRAVHSYVVAVAIPEDEIAPALPGLTSTAPFADMPRTIARPATPSQTGLAAVRVAPQTDPIAAPSDTLEPAPLRFVAAPVSASPIARAIEDDARELHPSPVFADTKKSIDTKLALLQPNRDIRDTAAVPALEPLQSFEADDNGKPIRPGICEVVRTPRPGLQPAMVDSGDFGLRLAKAAETQVGNFVVYNNDYRSISYPMGDVHPLYGVCTDVIVRAYRAIGIDLQSLVHQSRAGNGDTSIDHRRTEILRRFFAREGETLPITTFPEDYRPGDIVTYYREQSSQGARLHVAVVSSVIAASGRPMIVHNRGWGPQLEDDEITGHYRYRGPVATRSAASSSAAKGWNFEAPVPIVPTSLPAPGRVAPAGHP